MLNLYLILVIIIFLLCYAIAKNNDSLLAKNSELLSKIVCKSPEYVYCSETNRCVKADCVLEKASDCPTNTNYCPDTDECLPVCPQTRSKRFEEIRNNKLCTNVINVNVVSYLIGTENKSTNSNNNNNNNNKAKITQQINNNNQALSDKTLIKNKPKNSNTRPNSVTVNEYVLNGDRNNKVYVLEVRLVIQKDYSEFVRNNLKETTVHLLAQISMYFNLTHFAKDFSIAPGSVIIKFKIPRSKQKIVEDYISGAKNLTLTDIRGNRYLVKNISAKYLDAANNEVENKLITVRNSLSLKQHSNSKTISSKKDALTGISKTSSQEESTVSSELSSNLEISTESEAEIETTLPPEELSSLSSETTSTITINTGKEIQVATTLRQYITSGSTDTTSPVQTNLEKETNPMSQPLQDATTVSGELSSETMINKVTTTLPQEESSSLNDRQSPNFTEETKVSVPNDVTAISSDLSSNAQSITALTELLVTSTSSQQQEKTSESRENSSPEKQIILITVLQETTIVADDVASNSDLSTTTTKLGITSEATQEITPLPNNISPDDIPLTTARESQITTNLLPEVTTTAVGSTQITTTEGQEATATSVQEIPINTTIEVKTTSLSDISPEVSATIEENTKTLSTLPQETTSISNDISSNAPLSTENMSKVTTALIDNSPTVTNDATSSMPSNTDGESSVTSAKDVTTSTSNDDVLTTKSMTTEQDSTKTGSPKDVTQSSNASNDIPLNTGIVSIATTSVTQEVPYSASLSTEKELIVTTNMPQEVTIMSVSTEKELIVTTKSPQEVTTTDSNDVTSNIPLNTVTESKVTTSSQEVATSSPTNDLLTTKSQTTFENTKITSEPQEITPASEATSHKPVNTGTEPAETTSGTQEITPSIPENTGVEVTVTTILPPEVTSDVSSNAQIITTEQITKVVVTNTAQDIPSEISGNGVTTTTVNVMTNTPQEEIMSVSNTPEIPISSEKESRATSQTPQDSSSSMPNSISSDIPISTVKITATIPQEEVTVATTEQEVTKTTEKLITTEIVSSAEQTAKSPQTRSILLTTLKPEVQIDDKPTQPRVSLAVQIVSDFVSVVGDGIANENSFVAHIQPQLAQLLRVPFASIVNVTATPGSVVIRFDLIPVSNQEFSVNLESLKAAKQEFEKKISENKDQYIADRSGNNHKLCLLNMNDNNSGSNKNNTQYVCCQTPASNASLLTSDGYLILVIAIIAIIATVMMVLVTAYTVRWYVTNKYKRKTRPDYPTKFAKTLKPIINGRIHNIEANALNTIRILEGLKTRDSGDSNKSYDSGVWINNGSGGSSGGAHEVMANGGAKQVPEPHQYCPPDDTEISGTPKIPPEVRDKLRTQWKINDDKLFR